MSMYLFTFESGDTCKSETIDPEDLQSVNDGYLYIIDISDPDKPKDYYQGTWSVIENCTKGDKP